MKNKNPLSFMTRWVGEMTDTGGPILQLYCKRTFLYRCSSNVITLDGHLVKLIVRWNTQCICWPFVKQTLCIRWGQSSHGLDVQGVPKKVYTHQMRVISQYINTYWTNRTYQSENILFCKMRLFHPCSNWGRLFLKHVAYEMVSICTCYYPSCVDLHVWKTKWNPLI